jgi:GTP-binding protein
MEIRNIAIIAHVDHGKTTLTDALLKQNGAAEGDFSMDSNSIEKERGITIYAKNTSLMYKDTKVNIVDTPGHADFGSEVERVLRSIDSVLLVVDAQEGPMPQTRFVLKKSLELGIKPILVLNKIDKPAADVVRAHDEVFELFLELGANDEQLNFTTVYAIGRQGIAFTNIEDAKAFMAGTNVPSEKTLNQLLDTILAQVKPANTSEQTESATFKAQVFNLAYDKYLGRLAIARVYEGKCKDASELFLKGNRATEKGKITKMFSFSGVQRKEVAEISAGDIVMIAGFPSIFIGDTMTNNADTDSLPLIAIDEPTISLDFLVNNSPFAGREGKLVTGRQIRERLERELEINVGLKVDFNEDKFRVYGRGEMHISVLLENMRREGYEVQVSMPEVIIKTDENGNKVEPFEEAVIDVPTEFSGAVIQKLGLRKGMMKDMREKAGVDRKTVQRVISDRNENATMSHSTSKTQGKQSSSTSKPTSPNAGKASSKDDVYTTTTDDDYVPFGAEDVTEPTASIVLDALEKPVPANFRESHALGLTLMSIGRDLDKFRQKAKELSEKPGGEWLRLQNIDEYVRSLKAQFQDAAYHTVCPRCKGKGKDCKKCDGIGWVPDYLKGTI